ncbi:MAG: sigma-70 family RNA polymerase sigma factor [Anaerolineales bacterium]|nr:sigma-70 family RNA polymerase sigma factor [Anaerolineales bacterium]
MEELEAICLLKRGDLNGLDPLVQLYYFPAVKAAYLIVQDRAAAEDIVQDAFLHACQKIDQLASDRFGPWFLRSVVHAAIKAARKQKKLLSLDAAGDQAQSLEDVLIDRQPSPETLAEVRDRSRQVWQALSRLPAEQRAAVVLKYYLELSEKEMSRVLHCPLTTIKWRLYAARQRLRQLLPADFFPVESSPRSSSYVSQKQE